MSETTSTGASPTVVLVHGAFADASSWNGVIERLQAAGVTVTAPANPLRGVASDTAYLASVLEQTPGPVLAVGHSYAGAIISAASAQVGNVVGLVFVCAFIPDAGEVLGQVSATSKDSLLMPALVPRQYPGAAGDPPATELLVDPAKFPAVFAADLPAAQAAALAASQRPAADAAFSDVVEAKSWQNLPSWAVIGTGDRAAGADLTRSMAERAGAVTTEVTGSHLVMVSQSRAVADVILLALAAVGRADARPVAGVR